MVGDFASSFSLLSHALRPVAASSTYEPGRRAGFPVPAALGPAVVPLPQAAGAGALSKAGLQPPEEGPVNLELQSTSPGRLGERGPCHLSQVQEVHSRSLKPKDSMGEQGTSCRWAWEGSWGRVQSCREELGDLRDLKSYKGKLHWQQRPHSHLAGEEGLWGKQELASSCK